MADPRGFISTPRQSPARRPVAERVGDWREVYEGGLGRASLPIIAKQAGRCMDCGVPFCHSGCPLGNLIPEWNDLVWRGEWDEALDRLHATNNFPEFTGRLCPAPCETSCVVAISREAVTIKNVEAAIIDKAWDEHRVVAEPPHRLTSRTVAVVGSGPAGLATAQQLTRIGHTVVVYERDDRIGGLLRYGIPEFKMEKSVLDRRLEQMVDEGTRFETGVEIGRDITGSQLRERFDAVVLATGATVPRELPLEGRGLEGIHQAMDYLVQANRVAVGEQVTGQIHAAGKDVVIVGGGDTGADCLGTAVRQGARSVTLLRRSPEPPTTRPAAEP
ncbi:MAG: glutamate synthase subunit beta, partial [Propionibacterium sp.]|nr:glutamate synthase subunit beta [Propionibacterium sp.]